MAVRPAPNPSDNVNAPLNACLWDRRAARRHARTVHPARSVPPAVPTPTAPVYCAPSPRSSAATAAALLTAGPHRLASPPGSLLCSSSAAPFPLGDGVVGTTHSQAGREPRRPSQSSTFGGTLPTPAPPPDTRYCYAVIAKGASLNTFFSPVLRAYPAIRLIARVRR